MATLNERDWQLLKAAWVCLPPSLEAKGTLTVGQEVVVALYDQVVNKVLPFVITEMALAFDMPDQAGA